MSRVRALREDSAALRGALSTFLRMPASAREYLEARQPGAVLLLSGLSKDELASLRAHCDGERHPQLLLGDRDAASGRAVLAGRLEQQERLARELGDVPLGPELVEALARKPERARWKVGDALLPARTLVMGVVNVTPDSFSDGGKFLDPNAAISQGLRLVAEGADVLDVGGESTRPGGGVYGAGMTALTADDELARVLPVIRGLVAQTNVPISVDTRKLEVARAALEVGAQIVNDVSGLSHAPELAGLCAERKASLCLMHAKGDFRTMQVAPTYEDLVAEVGRFLADAAAKAEAAGVEPARIAIDPGIGFGKTREHNVELIAALPAFAAPGYPVLLGASRKAFIGALTGVQSPGERAAGSVGAACAAAMRGASIVRVHDVKPTVEALRICDAVLASQS